MINEKLLQALKATVTNTDRAYFLWGDALAVVAEELAKDPARAAAVRDALVEHVPADPVEPPPDFPDRTPAQIDGDRVRAVVGKYNAIRLTGPQVNALCEAAQLTGNWSKPSVVTWSVLIYTGLVYRSATGAFQPTEAGRAWLRAEDLLRDEASR